MPAQDDEHYEVLSGGEMRRKYGLYAENRPLIKLDAGKVPAKLRGLIPLAEKWGIGDDLIREDMVAKHPEEAKELKEMLATYEDDFDEWLAAPEAPPSEEYNAFTALRMAAYEA
jgi:hypothetical protein